MLPLSGKMIPQEEVAIHFCDALHEMAPLVKKFGRAKALSMVVEELGGMLMQTGDDLLLVDIAEGLKKLGKLTEKTDKKQSQSAIAPTPHEANDKGNPSTDG